MGDIISLLPESISNKIAAGEVIQRPSSVVKELLENSIDALSTEIILKIEDAGKTLIQVIDNGIGMSKNDILMSIKKHATSKLRSFEDLYTLKTMGFRGEGIPSIVSVADVEISSNNSDDNIGNCVSIRDSVVESISNVSMKRGTIFTVKNIFYNVPARREFLKNDNIELNYINKEFIRSALVNYDKRLQLIVDSKEKFNLESGSQLKRISEIFKDKNSGNLIFISESVDTLGISGYVINPSSARRNDEMYIYINNRYIYDIKMRNCIIEAYSGLIDVGKNPFCVINITIPQDKVDVNVSPSKTLVKFKNEDLVYNFVHNVIKRKLFYCDTPSLKFDVNDCIEPLSIIEESDDKLFNVNNTQSVEFINNDLFNDSKDNVYHETYEGGEYLILSNGYILSLVKSGVLLVNILRAYRRVVYDELMNNLKKSKLMSQQVMFPHELYFSREDIEILKLNYDYLNNVGFTIVFELNSIKIVGIPTFLKIDNLSSIIDVIVELFNGGKKEDIYSEIIKNVIFINKDVDIKNINEAKSLMNKLFCGDVNIYDPFNKRIFVILDQCSLDDIIDN